MTNLSSLRDNRLGTIRVNSRGAVALNGGQNTKWIEVDECLGYALYLHNGELWAVPLLDNEGDSTTIDLDADDRYPEHVAEWTGLEPKDLASLIAQATDILRRSDTRLITYGELQNGDLIWLCGWLYRVDNVTRFRLGSDQVDTVRFDGSCPALQATGYGLCRLGGYADRPCTVVNDPNS